MHISARAIAIVTLTAVIAAATLALWALPARAQEPTPTPTILADTRIIFRKAGGLFLTKPDGTGVTQVNGDPHAIEPRWSPDGSKIAYKTYDGEYKLILINPDGSESNVLVNGGSQAIAWFAWSPDSTRITFTGAGLTGVWSINRDGSNLAQLMTAQLGVGGDFDWSPDGTKFVSRDSTGIFVVNVDGSNKTLIRPAPGGFFEALPRWSPDGSKIVFNSAENIPSGGTMTCTSVSCPSAEIYVMNANGSGVTNLTNNSVEDSNPAWSPDGTKIAFYSTRSSGDGLYVLTMTDLSVTKIASYSISAVSTSVSVWMAFTDWSPFLPTPSAVPSVGGPGLAVMVFTFGLLVVLALFIQMRARRQTP